MQELTEVVGSTQQNVSKHLSVLRDAGIVRAAEGRATSPTTRSSTSACFALCEDVCGSLEQQYRSLHGVVVGARG